MAAPAVVAAAKAAVAVVTDPKLRKIVGGIILGIIIVIIAPIAILLGVMDTGSSIDWQSPEMQQQIYDNMTDEEKARMQHFADAMQFIEDEITAQGLDIEPIKAQVIFLSTLIDREETDTLYSDFVSCFAGDADDETIFNNLADKFGVNLTAEEKEKILLLVEKAVESVTVPPSALHTEIGNLLAGDTTPVNPNPFVSPFHGLDWQVCLSSGYGSRTDPITGEKAKHSGLDLAADAGTPIYPVKPGKVLFIRNNPDGYGNYLAVSHGGGQASLYGHCSEILVAEGDEVTTDTVIAQVGSTGRSTGNHCHLEIIIDGKPVNPKKFLEVTTP
jgi:hypothetical protein